MSLSLQGKTLEEGFLNPPQSARPHSWWHWPDGVVTKAGITKDLEFFKQSGVFTIHLFNAKVEGALDGPASYYSEHWRDCVKHTLKTASELGLEVGMHNCGGWSSSGGPWVPPEDAMKKADVQACHFMRTDPLAGLSEKQSQKKEKLNIE